MRHRDPPQICSPPPPHPEDCPLHAQRLDYGSDEPLRRAILMERRKTRTMAELVWADMNRQRQRANTDRPEQAPPTSPPTRPAPALPPASVSAPVFVQAQKGATP